MQGRPATVKTTFGELVAALWDAFYEEHGDEELATLATATLLQERLLDHRLALAEAA